MNPREERLNIWPRWWLPAVPVSQEYKNESSCLCSIMGPENSWPGGKKQWLDQLLPEQGQQQEHSVMHFSGFSPFGKFLLLLFCFSRSQGNQKKRFMIDVQSSQHDISIFTFPVNFDTEIDFTVN